MPILGPLIARGRGIVRGILEPRGVDKVPLFLAHDVCRARFVLWIIPGIEMDDLDLAGGVANRLSSGGQLAEIATDVPIRLRTRRVRRAELIVRLGTIGLTGRHRRPIAVRRIRHPYLFEIGLGREHLMADQDLILGASGRSPTKRLWIVKRRARVHGRRLSLQLR